MSSGVGTSLDFSPCLKISRFLDFARNDSGAGALRRNRPAVPEKLSLRNQVGHFRWNHLLPSAVAGL